MRALTGETLLAAWESGLGSSPQRAALAVLAFAEPERSYGQWARAPLGERNAKLLELRAASLGRRLLGFAICPECGAQIEFALDAVELAQNLRAQQRAQEQAPTPSVDGQSLRPANTLDLIAASAACDEAEACGILLARALGPDEADAAEAEPWLRRQPAEVVDGLARAFDAINAAAEIRARFDCAACGAQRAVDIDAALFLLDDISRTARRLLGEIHELARAYGWSQDSILAMSAARRSAYLELLRR